MKLIQTLLMLTLLISCSVRSDEAESEKNNSGASEVIGAKLAEVVSVIEGDADKNSPNSTNSADPILETYKNKEALRAAAILEGDKPKEVTKNEKPTVVVKPEKIVPSDVEVKTDMVKTPPVLVATKSSVVTATDKNLATAPIEKIEPVKKLKIQCEVISNKEKVCIKFEEETVAKFIKQNYPNRIIEKVILTDRHNTQVTGNVLIIGTVDDLQNGFKKSQAITQINRTLNQINPGLVNKEALTLNSKLSGNTYNSPISVNSLIAFTGNQLPTAKRDQMLIDAKRSLDEVGSIVGVKGTLTVGSIKASQDKTAVVINRVNGKFVATYTLATNESRTMQEITELAKSHLRNQLGDGEVFENAYPMTIILNRNISKKK